MAMLSIPYIRFNKFDNEWFSKKLDLVSNVTMGQSPDSKNYTDNPNDYILVQGNADMQNGRVVPRVWTTQITKLAEKGDLILSVRAPVGDIGKTDYNVVLGRGVAAIKGNEFLFQLLTKMKQSHYWSKFSTGSTFESINSNDIKSAEIYLPSIEEQSAIGSLFHTLDDLLASYKDSLANYQSLKATMLSKMFPKAGQNVPEIRLDGFKGDWEVKELGNIVDFYTGLTYKPNDMVSDGTLVLRSSNVRDGEFIYKDNVFVNPDIVNCQNVKLGDIVVVVRNGSRDLIGKHALIKSEMPNTVIGAFMTGVRYDAPEFINALLDTEIFISEINKNLGSTINQITTGNFKRMKFHFPDKEEQRAIGSYFTNFDNLIVAHREKITQLETLKKKLLQDMFI